MLLVIVIGAVAGAIAGWVMGRWLHAGGYRDPEDTPRQDLRRAWLVVPACVLAGGLGGACPGWSALSAWVYLVGGVAVSWIDLDVHRVPDRFLVRWAPLLAAAVVITAAVTGEWPRLLWALVGAAGMAALYLVLVLVGSMGLGDLKLAVVTGLLTGVLGWASWVTGVTVGLAAGAAAAVWLLARGRGRSSHLALAPAIVVGGGAAVLRVALGL